MNDGGTLAPELALLSVLNNLRNKNGTDFNPATYAIFKNWLLKADATNMAYMLSAQLAAVALSVEAGLTNGSASIVALDLLPFTAQITAAGVTISGLGVITINDLMTAANVALLADGNTPSGDVNRAYQEALKNALDAIANGQNIQVCAVVIN
jgi:hypothetical protein